MSPQQNSNIPKWALAIFGACFLTMTSVIGFFIVGFMNEVKSDIKHVKDKTYELAQEVAVLNAMNKTQVERDDKITQERRR